MKYTIYLKVFFPMDRVKWFCQPGEFSEIPAKGCKVDVCLPDGKFHPLSIWYLPEKYPGVVELESIRAQCEMHEFLKKLNGETTGEKWVNASIPDHVISRCVAREYREGYRTSTIEAMLVYAEGALRFVH